MLVTSVNDRARGLIAGLMAEPWGEVSPSVYETGRLVTLAPWLTGQAERIRFLLGTQQADGSWGAPDGYALVPTLSATEAMLTTLHRADERTASCRGELLAAVDRGLGRLFGWLREPQTPSLPDTPGAEIIVSALVAALNRHLELIRDSTLAGLDAWRGSARLRLPAGADDAVIAAIRSQLKAGAALPDKLVHALEVAGDAACRARGVHPVLPEGTVGASPAATAAWLGSDRPRDIDEPAVRYLQSVVGRHGGPVPCGMPITMFERGMVLSGLAKLGLDLDVPKELVANMEAMLCETGTPGGAGLPPDSDSTAVVLFALAYLGAGRGVDCLWSYELETHFCAWRGETNPSASVNAHVLEALGNHLADHPVDSSRCESAVRKTSLWLCDRQHADGSWDDRWHASPLYPTACSALALDRFGGDQSTTTVHRAVDWVLATQRADGSWGRWRGTAEETAYALQILLGTTPSPAYDTANRAAARGYAYLTRSGGRQDDALWVDKDLYLPGAMVRTAILAATHLARRSGVIASTAARS